MTMLSVWQDEMVEVRIAVASGAYVDGELQEHAEPGEPIQMLRIEPRDSDLRMLPEGTQVSRAMVFYEEGAQSASEGDHIHFGSEIFIVHGVRDQRKYGGFVRYVTVMK